MSFDNLCKLLAEKHPKPFANWLLGHIPDEITILKTELSIEPIRADSVTFFKIEGHILHIEFQTQWPIIPPMPLRMLDYWVRLYRLYGIPILQIVVVLLPPSAETIIENRFQIGSTSHEFTVVKMWEQDTELFLNDPVLLPFAALTQIEKSDALLQQISERIDRIESIEEKCQVSSYVQLMAGLKYNENILKRIFREDIMRESVIYQEIFQEGEAKGEAKGEAIGRQALRKEMVLAMLNEGISLNAIARLTELPLDQILQIQSGQNQ